jgi:transposase
MRVRGRPRSPQGCAPRSDRKSLTQQLAYLEEDDGSAGFRLRVDVNPAFDDWAALSEGAYLLRSNIADWRDEQLWKAYIQLTQAEAAFRIHKDQLRVRPIWHQHADRVQAHILVCFLAFVLWKTLEMWQQRAGLGNSPRTVLEELARIQSHDVVLPTPTHGDIRLRCITQPDAAQAVLLDHLGIVLPKRMRLADYHLPASSIA